VHAQQSTALTVPSRFAGPPGSANGGWIAGRLAGHFDARAVVVTLLQPPPLETPMDVSRHGDGVALLLGGVRVAEAFETRLDDDPIDPVSLGAAVQAAAGYPGLQAHPFPGCFVCGVERTDGLGLRPGILDDGSGRTACPWTPDASLADADGVLGPELAWAALDCPGGWAVDLAGRPMVLGRMSAQVDAVPAVGEPCVVMGRVLGREGRKSYTTTTLYDSDERVLGRAHAVWIEVDPSSIGRR
jgi:hypothetical protein